MREHDSKYTKISYTITGEALIPYSFLDYLISVR